MNAMSYGFGAVFAVVAFVIALVITEKATVGRVTLMDDQTPNEVAATGGVIVVCFFILGSTYGALIT